MGNNQPTITKKEDLDKLSLDQLLQIEQAFKRLNEIRPNSFNREWVQYLDGLLMQRDPTRFRANVGYQTGEGIPPPNPTTQQQIDEMNEQIDRQNKDKLKAIEEQAKINAANCNTGNFFNDMQCGIEKTLGSVIGGIAGGIGGGITDILTKNALLIVLGLYILNKVLV
jgi:hypothetical protein